MRAQFHDANTRASAEAVQAEAWKARELVRRRAIAKLVEHSAASGSLPGVALLLLQQAGGQMTLGDLKQQVSGCAGDL